MVIAAAKRKEAAKSRSDDASMLLTTPVRNPFPLPGPALHAVGSSRDRPGAEWQPVSFTSRRLETIEVPPERGRCARKKCATRTVLRRTEVGERGMMASDDCFA